MTADFIARALEARRSGSGWMAKCPAHDDRSPSLSIKDGNGKVLLHCHAGCSQQEIIEALRVRGLWTPRESRDWTLADRREWARERHKIERNLPAARLWLRVAVIFGDEILDGLKTALSDPSGKEPDIAEIMYWTTRLAAWRQIDDSTLVSEFRLWVQRQPQLTASMVRAAQGLEQAELAALRLFLKGEEADAA